MALNTGRNLRSKGMVQVELRETRPAADVATVREKTMIPLITPVLGNLIWVGGGSVGLLILIVLVVLLIRR